MAKKKVSKKTPSSVVEHRDPVIENRDPVIKTPKDVGSIQGGGVPIRLTRDTHIGGLFYGAGTECKVQGSVAKLLTGMSKAVYMNKADEPVKDGMLGLTVDGGE